MARKPTMDVSTYSKPANLPGFFVELMLSSLVVRSPVQGAWRKGSTGDNADACQNVSPSEQKAAVDEPLVFGNPEAIMDAIRESA